LRFVVILLVVALIVLHHDIWWWDDRTIVLGFLPIGLAWHALLSMAAGVVGWLAVTFCWPREFDDEVPANDPQGRDP
jgi:hypothetical protein